ncbi:MAG: hypothetical protein P4L50_08325 [Anaerolineaceae bacterium]|nr:hypothetical protein [Anaerolineaceae bacterium]
MKKKQRKSQAAILEILRVIRKNQKEFAEGIGAEPGEVRQWTMTFPRPVPVEYQRRIMGYCGAVWDDSGSVWQAGGGRRRFTRKFFADWRERLIEMHKNRAGFPKNPYSVAKPNGERYDRFNIEDFLSGRVRDVIERTMAAAEDRRGENNHRRLFAVLESLIHWSEGIAKDFKLSDSKHLQDVHRETKRSGIIEKTNKEKYIRPIQSIVDPPAAPTYDAELIIEKSSRRHDDHIERLKALAKKGDTAAIANLKRHGIKVEEPVKPLRR